MKKIAKSVVRKSAAKKPVVKPAVKKEAPKAAKPVDKAVVKFDAKVAQAVAKAGAAVPAKADVKDPKIVMAHATTGVVVSGKPAEKPSDKPAEKQPKGTIIVSRAEFEKDLAVVNDLIERKSTLPVLTTVLVSSDGSGHVTITATTLEQWWSKIIAGKGDKVGRCIPAALLMKEIKALPEDVLEIQIEAREDGTVRVNGRCTIYTFPESEFPETPQPKGMKEIHIDGLVEGLQRVSHAMGENDGRFVLNGAYIDAAKGLVVATDGHRVAYDGIQIRGEKPQSIILPRKAVLLMAKHPAPPTPKLVRDAKVTLAADNPDMKLAFALDVFGHKVQVTYEPQIHNKKLNFANVEYRGPVAKQNVSRECLVVGKIAEGIKKEGTLRGFLQACAEQMYMELHKTVAVKINAESPRYFTYPLAGGAMTTRDIEGVFPNYQAVIPKTSPIKIKFNTDAFLQNIEGARPLSPKNSMKLRVNGKLEIETETPETGRFKWHIPCETTGKKGDLVIGFNIGYLVDAIKAFRGMDTVLELTDALGPCRVNTKAVVMPMRA